MWIRASDGTYQTSWNLFYVSHNPEAYALNIEDIIDFNSTDDDSLINLLSSGNDGIYQPQNVTKLADNANNTLSHDDSHLLTLDNMIATETIL